MEKEKSNKGVIALLIVIIFILAVLCVLFATNTINFKSVKSNDNLQTVNNCVEYNNNEISETSSKYEMGDVVKLSKLKNEKKNQK